MIYHIHGISNVTVLQGVICNEPGGTQPLGKLLSANLRDSCILLLGQQHSKQLVHSYGWNHMIAYEKSYLYR